MGQLATCPGGLLGGATCCTLPQTRPATQRLDSGLGAEPSELGSWDFNVLELAANPHRLAMASLQLLQGDAWACGASDTDALGHVIVSIQDGYLQNPYHNFAHGVDALQMLVLTGRKLPWDSLLSPLTKTALMIAALAHDIGHPGLSNGFLVNVQDEMAVRYNDISPLENMHCTRLLELLQQDRNDIFHHLTRQSWQSTRRLIIDVIIHTDSAICDRVLSKLEALYVENADVFWHVPEGKGLEADQLEVLNTETNRSLVSRALLINADFASQVRSWESASTWASLMREEFLAQGDREGGLAMTVVGMHDRSMSLLEVQLGILHTRVTPFVCAEVRLFRALSEIGRKLSKNIDCWASRQDGASQRQDGASQRDADSLPHKFFDFRVESMLRQLSDAVSGRLGVGERGSSKEGGALQSSARRQSEAHNDHPTANCTDSSCREASPRPIVREIRRWQEANNGFGGGGCSRELVMLYVVSEDMPGQPAPSGQPVLFRYTIAADSRPECGDQRAASHSDSRGVAGSSTDGTRSPFYVSWNAAPTGHILSVTSPASSHRPSLTSNLASRLEVPHLVLPYTSANGSSGQATPQPRMSLQTTTTAGSSGSAGFNSPLHTAQVALDSACVKLDETRFDAFLGAVLEDMPELLHNARGAFAAKAELEELKSQNRRTSLRRSVVSAVTFVGKKGVDSRSKR